MHAARVKEKVFYIFILTREKIRIIYSIIYANDIFYVNKCVISKVFFIQIYLKNKKAGMYILCNVDIGHGVIGSDRRCETIIICICALIYLVSCMLVCLHLRLHGALTHTVST